VYVTSLTSLQRNTPFKATPVARSNAIALVRDALKLHTEGHSPSLEPRSFAF